MRLGPFITFACVLSLTAPAIAEPNPHLARARSEKRALQYDQARQSLAEAEAWGKSSADELAEIYRLRGEIAAGLGDPAAAEQSFRRLLALRPNTGLPQGTSPKIAEPFAAARAYVAARKPLSISHSAAPSALVITVETDPMSMVAGARVDYLEHGRWKQTSARGSGRLRLTVPASSRLPVTIAVVDRAGNTLLTIGSRDAPIELATVRPTIVTRTPDRPLFTRWPLWAGLAAVTGGVGIYFGLDSRGAQSDLDDIYADRMTTEFDDVADRIATLENRGQRSALLANISFAIAGATAITAVIFLIRGDPPAASPPGIAFAF